MRLKKVSNNFLLFNLRYEISDIVVRNIAISRLNIWIRIWIRIW